VNVGGGDAAVGGGFGVGSGCVNGGLAGDLRGSEQGRKDGGRLLRTSALHVLIEVWVSRNTVTACKTLRGVLLALVVRRGVVARRAPEPKVAYYRTHHWKKNSKRLRRRGIPLKCTEDTRKNGVQAKRGVTSKGHRVHLVPHAKVKATVAPIMGVGTNLQQRIHHLPQCSSREKDGLGRLGITGRKRRILVGCFVASERLLRPGGGGAALVAALATARGHRPESALEGAREGGG